MLMVKTVIRLLVGIDALTVVSLVGIDALTVVNLKKVHVSFHCSHTLAPLI